MADAAMSRRVAVVDAGAPEFDIMAALHAKCFDEAWDRNVIARVFAMAGAFGLLARPAGRPAGFIICRTVADECEILSIGVAPDYRRQGIGRELVYAALVHAAAAGAGSLYLEVAEDNVAARALYAAADFAPVGRRPRYYRRTAAAPMAAIVLRRNIVPHDLRSRSR